MVHSARAVLGGDGRVVVGTVGFESSSDSASISRKVALPWIQYVTRPQECCAISIPKSEVRMAEEECGWSRSGRPLGR